MKTEYVVVIPSRNRYLLALRAIRSVLSQTIQPAEILFVDDASDDERYQWLGEIVGDIRLTVIRREIPSRDEWRAGFAVGAVRNTALDYVCRIGFDGWVAFLDDDDEWVPEKMATQFAAASVHQRFGVISSNALNRSIDGTVTGWHHGDHGVHVAGPCWDVTAMLPLFNPVINSTAIVRAGIAERLGRQQAVGFGEDYDYWKRAARMTNVLRIEEPLAYYTIGNQKEYEL